MDADETNIYIPAWGASVSAVNLQTGIRAWVWEPGVFPTDTAPSTVFRSGSMGVRVSGDTVFATVWHYLTHTGGASEAWLVALNKKTGVELWRVRLPHEGSGVMVEAAPIVYSGLVIVHTLAGITYAVDRLTKQVVWQHIAPAATLSTVAGPAISGDVVYVDGGNRNIFALSASNGRELWTSPFPSATSRDMLVTDRRLVFTNGGTLFILNKQDGRKVASLAQPRASDPLFASPAGYSDGFIFLSVADAAWCFAEP